MAGDYILGIDGGGTKTEAAVVDRSGSVLGTGISGGSNINFVPRRSAAVAYRRAIRQALSEASAEASDIACAGCTFGWVAEAVFAELGIDAEVMGWREPEVAFMRAGVAEANRIALIAGTGSSCTGYSADGRHLTSGGWGAVLGDEGSAYDIGLRGAKRALASIEGRMPPTLLAEKAVAYFGGGNRHGIVARFCGTRVNQALVAGFATRICEAAQERDEAALLIMEEAGEALGELAAFVARSLFAEDDEIAVALAGGVFSAGRLVIDPIRCVLLPQFPRARLVTAAMSPGEAVARLTLHRCLRGGELGS